tara:strand:- start:155 stop:373 length:219 start_codon:yes stop_codon:yes gene_type:complete
MKYINTTRHVILVPNRGELQAVAPGAEVELLYASMEGLSEVIVKPQATVKAKKPAEKKPVEKKVNVSTESKS